MPLPRGSIVLVREVTRLPPEDDAGAVPVVGPSWVGDMVMIEPLLPR